ncbi:sugar transferase [Serinicoccus sediminis]|uniref:sugar transferase n=1 Tax=Serinicoccus sediminis TaxID=2306021 RepID=UPI00101F43AB|nr:sugar transferase [Serinicoccus sediminis]
MSYRGKRVLDLAVAVPVALITAPIQAVVAGAIRTTMGRPILFRQDRPGLHGETFSILKFRTMLTEEAAGTSHDALRLTPLGKFLRSTSVDELPTLWNVIQGDMSLVGPRPLLTSYLARYSPEQARRHDVRPGLTGLAQVRGRNSLTWEEKFGFDLEYVDSQSLRLDLRIIAETVTTVVRRTGISAADNATMPEFLGSSATSTEPRG